MNTEEDNKMIKNESVKKGRRKFLKKAVYSAPTLVTLGYLSKPTSAFADYNQQGVPCGGAGQPPCL